GREQVELPRPAFRDHFEIAGLPGRVLEFDLNAASRPAEFYNLWPGPDDPAEDFDRLRLLARSLLAALNRPVRGEALLYPELRPGGQAVPDFVLVPALERLQKLREGRSGHRLPLGPDDGGEVGASPAPREEQRQERHPDERGKRVLEHGHLTGWKRTGVPGG